MPKRSSPDPKTAPREVTDTGTPEIARRHTVRLELTGRGHAVRARVTDSSEIDRLYALSLITQDQHSAGETLARHLHRAHMLGLSVSRLSRTTAAPDISASQSDALAAVGDAIAWLDHHAGQAARQAVVSLLIDDARPVGAPALRLVRTGLDTLLALRPERSRAQAPPTLWD